MLIPTVIDVSKDLSIKKYPSMIDLYSKMFDSSVQIDPDEINSLITQLIDCAIEYGVRKE